MSFLKNFRIQQASIKSGDNSQVLETVAFHPANITDTINFNLISSVGSI